MGITYLVGGTPRSGKSTIRKTLLEKYKIPGITTDLLREGFQYGVPSFGIKKGMTDLERSEVLKDYFKGLVIARRVYTDNFLIEGTNFLPKYLVEFKDNPDVKICFLGYCQISIEDKFKFIRETPGLEDWTTDLTNEQLRSTISEFIEQSKYYRDECAKYGLKFFDTSHNFENTIDEAIEFLLN